MCEVCGCGRFKVESVPPLCSAMSGCSCVRDSCLLSGCRSQCNGCMNAAWGLCWGASQSTRPCVFACKVASAGDGSAKCAAAVVSRSNRFLLCVLQ